MRKPVVSRWHPRAPSLPLDSVRFLCDRLPTSTACHSPSGMRPFPSAQRFIPAPRFTRSRPRNLVLYVRV